VLPAAQQPPRVTVDTATTLRSVFSSVIRTCKYRMLIHNLDLFIRQVLRKIVWSRNTFELSKYLWFTYVLLPSIYHIEVRATRSFSNQMEGSYENYYMNGVLNFDHIC